MILKKEKNKSNKEFEFDVDAVFAAVERADRRSSLSSFNRGREQKHESSEKKFHVEQERGPTFSSSSSFSSSGAGKFPSSTSTGVFGQVPVQLSDGVFDLSKMPEAEVRRYKRAFGHLPGEDPVGNMCAGASSGWNSSSSSGVQVQREDQYDKSSVFRSNFGRTSQYSAGPKSEQGPEVCSQVRRYTLGVRSRPIYRSYDPSQGVKKRRCGEAPYLWRENRADYSGSSGVRSSSSGKDEAVPAGGFSYEDSGSSETGEDLSSGSSSSSDDFSGDDEDFDYLD